MICCSRPEAVMLGLARAQFPGGAARQPLKKPANVASLSVTSSI